MATEIKLDLTKDDLLMNVGEDVEISTMDKDEFIILTMDQMEYISDLYYKITNGPLRSDLEEEILKLKNKVEELESIIEYNEEHDQAKKEKYYDNEIF